MKFANLFYDRKGGRLTLGDDMQLLAIEDLYETLGIERDKIIRIPYSRLYDYDGEYAVLPLSFPFLSVNDEGNVTCFSPKIVPVFLGLCILTPVLSAQDVAYLRRFAPIGCRDWHTLQTMRKYQIDAYLNGCMTLSFPKRVSASDLQDRRKIYCIDVEESLKKEIPEALLNDCVFLSHSRYAEALTLPPEQECRRQYNEYIREARLVITSRLHAASPCAAAGLPVVFAKETYSYRFTAVDRVLPIYSGQEFGQIDWKPLPIDFEDRKTEIRENARRRLSTAFGKYEQIYALSEKMEPQSERDYYYEFYSNTLEYIQTHWEKTAELGYYLWGCTQLGQMLYSYIKEAYPKARFLGAIDSFRDIEFLGKRTLKAEALDLGSKDYVFVTTGSATNPALEFFAARRFSQYYLCALDKIVIDHDHMDASKAAAQERV